MVCPLTTGSAAGYTKPRNASIRSLLATLSGVANGLFTAPMKMRRAGKWENIWFVFIVTACLGMPFVVLRLGSPGLARFTRGANGGGGGGLQLWIRVGLRLHLVRPIGGRFGCVAGE